MKTKYTISVLLIAFLMAFSIPIFGGPHSTINNNTKMGIQTSDLTPDVEIEDFSSEEHGTTGLDIDFIDEYHGYVSVYCDQYVNDGPFGTHSKVLYARDAQSGMNTWSVHYLNNPLTHGTIEFSLWLNPGSSCNSPHYHYLKFRTFSDITAFEFRFNLENGNVEYTDGSSYSSNILNLDTTKWYDYEITFDVSLGLYDLRCSEGGTQIEYIEDISYNNIVTIEELYIGTNVNDYGANSRWDDFRFAPDTPDVTAPITTIELSGNLGSNNWFVSDVWVTLTAIDDASGVDYTEYSYDGTNWHLYSEPFIIPTEGEITIYYRSIDDAGNQEAIKTQSLKIDTSDSITTISLNGELGLQGWYKSEVDVALEATDDYSGVDRIEYSFNGEDWIVYEDSFTITTEGYTDVYYQSFDKAGNAGTSSMKRVKIDYTSPVTTITLDGPILNENWYGGEVTIALSVTDNDSGVYLSEYSFDGVNWITYTGWFQIYDNGIRTLYYRSTDRAGNSEIPKSVALRIINTHNGEYIDGIHYHLENLIDMLTNLEIPEEAEHFIETTILFLTHAKDKFEAGMLYEGYDKIRDSMEFLVLAGDTGADVQEVLDYIMTLLKYSVLYAIDQVIDLVSEDNKYIARAIEYYNTALLTLTLENYDEAVRFFKLSFKNTIKARGELIEDTIVDDLLDKLDEIQELKTHELPNEALNYLDQAENKLLLAIDKVNNSMLSQALIQLKDVVNNLLAVQDFGIDTTCIIDSILENADDVTYLKILEAESILMGASNMHIDKAWINYNKAIDYWNAEKYEFALSYYAKAIEKVNDALA